MVPTGPINTSLCMNRNSVRQIKESEMINVCGGSLYEGYNSTICTPVVLGKIPSEIKDAVNVAYEAMNIVTDAIKPGVSSKELFNIYANFLDKKGYRKYSPYGSVHSLGMLECESPWFSVNRDVFMHENMTIAIDTYFKGLSWGSFRIEDTFVIRRNGAEFMTDYNKKYFSKAFK
jgi:Xaa-Pro aminopeptidase